MLYLSPILLVTFYAGILCIFFLSSLGAYIYNKNIFFKYWLIGWGLYLLCFFSRIIFILFPASELFYFLDRAFYIFANIYILAGILAFIDKSLPQYISQLGMYSVLIQLFGFLIPSWQLLKVIPYVLFCGILYIWGGIFFLRQTKPNRLLHEFSGFSIILWGISVFIFQLLYKLDFFVTAYIIGGLSVICLFTMIAIYYFVNLSEDIQKKRAEIQYLNIHDPLTNLYNRMYFDSLTKSNIDPFRLPVSIIVADVNGLKIVNDCFGHYEGDKLITYVSKILLQSCNDNSYIFRWGGDEFVIILPETKQNQAQLVLNNIKNNISQSPPLLVPLTIALGLSVKTSPNQTYTELYQNAEKAMYNNKMTEWQNNQLETIDYLNTYLFNEDIEKKAHNDRVITLTKELGVKLQLSDYALCRIMNVAKFHDIGKITIPKEILKKRGKLTKEEWAILKTYPEIGYRITRSSGEYASIANAILHIQEWWNGSGYPYSLSGKDIPFFSRIIAVVNTYDIMTHDQPYRKALSSDIALKEMKKLSEIQFDPEILTTFFKIVQS